MVFSDRWTQSAVALLAAGVLFGSAGVASATHAVLDVEDALTTIGTMTNRTLGWSFTAEQAITVTHLGVWDDEIDGLNGAHDVGIWDINGTLLRQVTVNAGTASTAFGPTIAGGQVRYEAITSLTLTAGQDYVIGALYNDDDFAIYEGSVITAPGITFKNERVNVEGEGFTYPSTILNRGGYVGPSFASIPVPEPASLGILGASGLFLLSRCRRS